MSIQKQKPMSPEDQALLRQYYEQRQQALFDAMYGRYDSIYDYVFKKNFTKASSHRMSGGSGKKVDCPRCNRKKGFRILKNFDYCGGFLCEDCGMFKTCLIALEKLERLSAKDAYKKIEEALNFEYPRFGLWKKGNITAKFTPRVTPVKESSKRTYSINKDAKSKVDKLLSAAVPAAGTLAELYLRRRGITCPIPPSILFAHDDYFEETEEGMPNIYIKNVPVMLTKMYNANNTIVVNLHRTYLSKSGGKLDVSLAKKSMAFTLEVPNSVMGVHVPLGRAHSKTLNVCEGLETGLSVLSANPNLRFSGNTNCQFMIDFPIPKGVEYVLFWADNDVSGTGQVRSAVRALELEKQGLKTKLPIASYTRNIYVPSTEYLEGKAWLKEFTRDDVVKRIEREGYIVVGSPPEANIDWNDVWLSHPDYVRGFFTRRKAG